MVRRRLNFAAIRARGETSSLGRRSTRVSPPPATTRAWRRVGRANFAELEQQLRFGMDYGYAFSEFLDELYLFRRPNFFAQALSGYFSAGQRAFLAATAAYLSNRFGLPVPDWVHRPEFVLAEEWDPGRQPR
jgi:hypothetical protein